MGFIFRRFITALAVSAFLASGTLSLAQSPDTPWDKNLFDDKEAYKEAYKEYQKGESLYKQGIYSVALTHYLPAQEFNPNNSELNMRIGQCYLYSSTKQEATKYLETALLLNERINISIHLLLGQAYQLEMEWFRAIEQYGRFITLATKDDVERIALARKRTGECQFGQDMVQHPIDIKIEALPPPVNTTFAEYHPLISADEAVMYFTSRRDNTTGGKRDVNYDVYYEDIYKTTQENGVWTEPVGIGPEVNTDYHDATVGLSQDGQQLFIYKDDVGDGNIYYCALDGDKWSKPVKLNSHVNSEFNESTACFSFDGMTIYFISDRPGGFGKNDIYIAKKDANGEWGIPKNLGAAINTPYNEDAVFMHPDGKTLYFSSEGHTTMGGYDIFKSVYDDKSGSWSTPKNMGYPINSSDDDVFFVLAANGERGYYSSIKSDGLGEKDIYMITFPDENDKPELTLVKGVIIDQKTGLPIYADIEIIDNEKNEVIARASSNKLTGEYLFSLPSGKDYGITVTADGYFFHSENIDIPESSPYFELLRNISLGEIGVGKSIVLNFIYFEYDKATLTPKSIVELERVLKLMNANPKLKIEISGHTDNKGTEAYNMTLSKRRAQAVVNWLASEGIERSKMTSKGYGFSKPVESNATEEGRAKNRRTEFKVLEYESSAGKPTAMPKESHTASQPEPENLQALKVPSLETTEPKTKVEPIAEAAPDPEPTPEATPAKEPRPAGSKPTPAFEPEHEPISEAKPSSESNKLAEQKTNASPEPEPVAGITPDPKPAVDVKPAPEELTPVEPESTADTGPETVPAITPDPVPATKPAVNFREFSSSKPDYYSTHDIEVDPVMPEGVIYRIQIGSFSKLPDGSRLKGLYPVTAMKLENGLYRCSVGEFKTYKEAKDAQQVVRSAGFADAFLIAFYKGEKITVSKAVNLE